MMSRRERISYALVRALLRALVLLLTRTSVRGREYLPRSGAGIVVSNHIAAVDPAILIAALPRPIALMSKVENARGVLKLFMPLVGAFTVRRGAPDRSALRMAEHVLAQGRLLCMFPEGTRSPNGALGPAHGGAALLAQRSAAPIIPVAITGTPRIFSRRFPWVGFPRVTVTLGPSFLAPLSSGPAQREQVTTEIMARIAGLLPPGQRGDYAGSVARWALTDTQ
ncbi:MAG TPA: lysophospholipid acyltransferase family protein [Roseiflexaceae bacterium]|nr:lysophospholipid acyltransferase family protein [Roseiflexaceae bacterium]